MSHWDFRNICCSTACLSQYDYYAFTMSCQRCLGSHRQSGLNRDINTPIMRYPRDDVMSKHKTYLCFIYTNSVLYWWFYYFCVYLCFDPPISWGWMLKGIFYWWLHVHDERVSDLNFGIFRFGFSDSGFKIYTVFFILFLKCWAIEMILKPMMDSHKTILWVYLASLLPQSEE